MATRRPEVASTTKPQALAVHTALTAVLLVGALTHGYGYGLLGMAVVALPVFAFTWWLGDSCGLGRPLLVAAFVLSAVIAPILLTAGREQKTCATTGIAGQTCEIKDDQAPLTAFGVVLLLVQPALGYIGLRTLRTQPTITRRRP